MVGINVSWTPLWWGQGAGDTKEGQDRRAAGSWGPPPSDPSVLSICLLGGGSLSGLVPGLTVPKCVTLSIIRGGWFCGEKVSIPHGCLVQNPLEKKM